MGRSSADETAANYNDKRAMSMLRMGWKLETIKHLQNL